MAAGKPATVTVTAKVGPNQTVTSLALTGVTSWSVDCINDTITIFGPAGGPLIFDIGGATTLTWTVSSNTYTLTIS